MLLTTFAHAYNYFHACMNVYVNAHAHGRAMYKAVPTCTYVLRGAVDTKTLFLHAHSVGLLGGVVGRIEGA